MAEYTSGAAPLMNRRVLITRAVSPGLTPGTFPGPMVEVPNGFGVVVQADHDNTAPVFVGSPTVNIGQGYKLAPGDNVTLYVALLQHIGLIAGATGQTVRAIVEQ